VRIIDRLDYPVSALPFGLFRIGMALVAMVQYADALYFRAMLAPEASPAWNAAILPLGVAGFAAAAWMGLGLWSRWAACANYLCVVGLFGFVMRNLSVTYALDWFVILGSLLCAVIPVGRAVSLDRYLGLESRATVSNWCVITFMVVLSCAYLDAFANKLTDDMWTSGLGVWLPMTQPFAVLVPFDWVTNSKFLSLSMGYAALAFQGLFPLLIWFRWLRLPIVVFGVMLHAGITLAFPCPLFGVAMLLFYLPLMPAWVYPQPGALEKTADKRWPLFLVILAYLVFQPPLTARRLMTGHDATAARRVTSDTTPKQRRSPIGLFLQTVRQFTGISMHALFMKHHWVSHSREYHLVFRDAEGEQVIPLTRPSGFSHFYAQERRWCDYSFFRYSTDPQKMRASLEPLIRLWAERNGVELSTGDVLLYSRLPETPMRWEPGLLQANADRKWELAPEKPSVGNPAVVPGGQRRLVVTRSPK
jgi:hypothetical protein